MPKIRSKITIEKDRARSRAKALSYGVIKFCPICKKPSSPGRGGGGQKGIRTCGDSNCKEQWKNIRMAKFREVNRLKLRRQNQAWATANPEKCKRQQYAWIAKNRERVNAGARRRERIWRKLNPSKVRARQKVRVEKLTNSYIATSLRLSQKEIPPEWFEIKRAALTLHRLIKEKST